MGIGRCLHIDFSTKKSNGLIFKNIEALATIETDGIHNFRIGEKQIATGRKYSTTEPGWTWDVGLQVGLFHGKVSKGQPSSYTEESSSEIVKINVVGSRARKKNVGMRSVSLAYLSGCLVILLILMLSVRRGSN